MESTTVKGKLLQLTSKAAELTVYGICLLCLALFASAAYGKIADHETFVKGLSKVSVIGGAAVYLAWFVPIAEIIVCFLLLIPALSKWGLYGFLGLMTVFTGYILSMLFWAEKLPCHCNLIIEKLSWGQHLWFNVGFMALAVFAFWLGKAKRTF
ncbi:MAG: MauE/DoxX family redox-associated membrane protein [Pedobacter sp.]|uniref:MauE/DoxX family redox-associated membrane protein n=1 Tax=Pedobacter sp. TaxID=1411316 RepID=UPI003564FB7E